jgi:NADH:ubiquinone oxidoreductase subunit F (NADH-binding)
MNYIEKLKKYNILGRGGAEFPAWQKWETAKNTPSEVKYVICNSSEGELGLFKDLYIWRNHAKKIFQGMKYAMDFIGSNEAYIHINKNYYLELQPVLFELINNENWSGYKFNISVEEPSYIGGEASTIINFIETKTNQPKPKTFRTAVKGLFGHPTLIQNVESFYDIARAIEDTYDNKRFSGIFGDGIKEKLVVRHKNDATLQKILRLAKVKPGFDFFVQVGGSASGNIYNSAQLKEHQMEGAGSIEIFDKIKRNELVFLKRLFKFYSKESCGKCNPCREGSFQLNQMVQDLTDVKDIPWDEIVKICELMSKISFCGLGRAIYAPVKTYMENVLGKKK